MTKADGEDISVWFSTIIFITWATIEETSPVLAGKIKVLLVLANDWNAVTYFSATAKEAAFDPLVCPNAFETYITLERKRG